MSYSFTIYDEPSCGHYCIRTSFRPPLPPPQSGRSDAIVVPNVPLSIRQTPPDEPLYGVAAVEGGGGG